MRLRAALLALAVTALGGAAAPATLDPKASYPEGPLWVGEALYVAEMGADRVSTYAQGRKRTFFHERGCGPTSIAPYGRGFLVTCHLKGDVVAVDGAGRTLARFGAGVLRDPNDSFRDRQGGVYFSDPGPFSKAARPSGRLYHLSAAGALTRVAEGLWYPNGVYFDDAENALYVSEHLARKVWRYRVEPGGALGARTLFADIDVLDPAPAPAYREAGPDGLERDGAGNLVVALYGEGRLLRIDRTGALVAAIPAPMRYVTNVAFRKDGRGVVVGAHNNTTPPFAGAVVWLD